MKDFFINNVGIVLEIIGYIGLIFGVTVYIVIFFYLIS